MDVSDTARLRPAPSQHVEVLEREQVTCDKHGTRFERRKERILGRAIAGVHFAPPARWVGQCPRCAEEQAQAEIEREREEQARQAEARMQARFGQAGVPKRLRSRSFENYEATAPGQGFVLTVCRDYAESFEEQLLAGSTLVLAGKTGTGKGHLAAAICMHVMRAGYEAFFSTSREILLMLRASWSDKDASSELEVLRKLIDVDLLVIDDIGVQYGTDAERDQLFSVIDGRYREQKPMILTTNLSANQLLALIGERSFSRLREIGQWVAFDWADWRVRNKTSTKSRESVDEHN